MRRKALPLIRRAQADLDVESALDHYIGESTRAAEGFVKAIERAYTHIGRAPDSGSPRWSQELNLPDLRSWPCTRYPYLVFYRVTADHIEIWRVLHTRLDLPSWLADEGSPGSEPEFP